MSRRYLVSPGHAVVLTALAACTASVGSHGPGPSPGTNTTCNPLAPPSSVLTAEDLRAAHVPRLLEAIERVRPTFLHTRAPRRDQSAVVYVDGTRVGDVLMLRDIPVADVVEVVFVRASDATTRFGTDHTGGALLVRTQAAAARGRCPGG
jgi:hypothetical protein